MKWRIVYENENIGYHGGRINLGFYGNTLWVARSPGVMIMIM